MRRVSKALVGGLLGIALTIHSLAAEPLRIKRPHIHLARASISQTDVPVDPPPVVAAAIDRAKLPTSAISLLVVPVEGGAPLVDMNTDRAQVVGSLMKLVTTYAALDLLGPTYTWRTQWLSSAPQVGDVLDGDLVVRASGDPKFLVENLELVLRDLRLRGLRELRGDLVVDRSAFAPQTYDEARFDQDPLRAYNVAPDAFLLNYKATAFRFIPLDDRVAIAMEPPTGQPIADVRALDGPCGEWRAQIKADLSDPLRPRFSGAMPRECGARSWYFNLASHDAYVRAAFEQAWTRLGGVVRPNFSVRTGLAPTDARILAEWTSPALAELIRDINKFSNNVMARQLFLSLGAEITKQPASQEQSSRVMGDWLSAHDIDPASVVFENGSGLSRIESMSARTLARLLVLAFNGPLMPEFVASLPIAGYDGTMRRRLTSNTVAGAAHIKTGTLANVRGIAGYVLAQSGRRYVVVSIVNSPLAAQASPVHDALLQWIYERG
ncbi:MAG TPA: D-alanyl-D-alanine carboxypeptidase/D-alanyl-D-alanine-endopeptidase [Burkholderiaceae bacterium]|nr:D-alanyl-D-alanine carboxypeptidase/D-alanyl-D-alanine-endopeptidase [Burkholderiaceae bacterium]